MKTFNVPVIYRSPLISAIKNRRKQQDRMKKAFTPTELDFGPLKILLARHFGFCYGVENAIEIAFKTVDENPGKRIFLLSDDLSHPNIEGFRWRADAETSIPTADAETSIPTMVFHLYLRLRRAGFERGDRLFNRQSAAGDQRLGH